MTSCTNNSSNISSSVSQNEKTTSNNNSTPESNSNKIVSEVISVSNIYTDQNREETYNKLNNIINNSTDYNILINKKISEAEFFKNYFFRNYSPLYSYLETMDSINEKFEVECLREMGNDNRYVVYKSNDGGVFYVYFRNKFVKSHSVYMINNLKYNDFQNVKIGDELKTVKNIDKSMDKWVDTVTIGGYDFNSTHLLKDGVIIFDYSKDDKGVYRITNINYANDFIIKKDFPNIDTVSYDYRILEMDYPH